MDLSYVMRWFSRLVPIAVVTVALGVFFLMPSDTHDRNQGGDPTHGPKEASGVVLPSVSGPNVTSGTASGDDEIVPTFAPQVVAFAKMHPVEAVLITVIAAFAIIDLVVLTRHRRTGPALRPSERRNVAPEAAVGSSSVGSSGATPPPVPVDDDVSMS